MPVSGSKDSRLHPFSIRPPPKPDLQGFQVSGSPVIRFQEFSILACRLPYPLPPDQPVPLRHVSGFPGPRVAGDSCLSPAPWEPDMRVTPHPARALMSRSALVNLFQP